MKRLTFVTILLFSIVYVLHLGATKEPEWWSPEWLSKSRYSPSFEVMDTISKYGRYANRTKTITIGDLIKFHGHLCGGLVESAGALKVAFNELFPDGIIDRTDIRIASNNSACGGDVASYLTGARTRFNSHFIDQNLRESEFVIQVSIGRTVRVSVKSEPIEVRKQIRKIESGNYKPDDIDLFRQLQLDYAQKIVSRSLNDTFTLVEASDYKWPEPPCRNLGYRKDSSYKEVSK